MKLPILGNVGLKEILILGGAAFVVHHFIKMNAATAVSEGNAKIPAVVPLPNNVPTSPVPPFREMQRLSLNARESSSGGCGCGG